MARRAVSPRHGLIMGLGPVSVPIFTHAGRRAATSMLLWAVKRLDDISCVHFGICQGMGFGLELVADKTGRGRSG